MPRQAIYPEVGHSFLLRLGIKPGQRSEEKYEQAQARDDGGELQPTTEARERIEVEQDVIGQVDDVPEPEEAEGNI